MNCFNCFKKENLEGLQKKNEKLESENEKLETVTSPWGEP